MKSIDYQQIFTEIEESLKNNLFAEQEEFQKKIKPLLNADFRKKSDGEVFWVLVYVVFYSGFKAVTIERRITQIKNYLYGFEKLAGLSEIDKQKIIRKVGFPKKCNYCFDNAVKFKRLVGEFGSFQNYVFSFGISDLTVDSHKLNLLRADLKEKFWGLGSRTVNHFLTDLGFNVLKPDRVVCRIFHRLGLIDSVEDVDGAIREGEKFAEVTRKPIRYVDIIFAKYGQMGRSEVLGTKSGICLQNNPKCEICKAKEFCKYYKTVVHISKS